MSSKEQEKEGYSVQAQQKLLQGYAADKGVRILQELVDIETAKKAGRTGFGERLRFLKKTPACRTILVEKTDRLYRNLKDYVTLDELDLEIHFIKENFILSRDSRSSQKFVHGIKVLMAKNYIDNLSEETRKGMQEKAEEGVWPGGAPTGYLNVVGPSGKKVIEPDPETAALVRQMFESYATGRYSLKEIAEQASAAGLIFRRSHNPRITVHKILQNRIYYGDFVWKGKVYRGVHTPLITRELWLRVQDVMRQRGTRKPRRVKHDFGFSGLLTCGHCGCALVGEIKKGRYVYYHCTGYKGKCEEPYVREEVLEKKFTAVLRGLTFDDEVLGWMAEALRQSHDDEKRCHDEAVVRLQAEYRRLQNRIDAMYIDKLDGKIDAAFYDQKASEWRAEQSRLLDALAGHQHANQTYQDEGVMLLELSGRAADLFERQEPREKRRLLDFVLSNSTWKNGELQPNFRQPFDMLADAATTCAEKKLAGGSAGELRQLMGG